MLTHHQRILESVIIELESRLSSLRNQWKETKKEVRNAKSRSNGPLFGCYKFDLKLYARSRTPQSKSYNSISNVSETPFERDILRPQRDILSKLQTFETLCVEKHLLPRYESSRSSHEAYDADEETEKNDEIAITDGTSASQNTIINALHVCYKTLTYHPALLTGCPFRKQSECTLRPKA